MGTIVYNSPKLGLGTLPPLVLAVVKPSGPNIRWQATFVGPCTRT